MNRVADFFVFAFREFATMTFRSWIATLQHASKVRRRQQYGQARARQQRRQGSRRILLESLESRQLMAFDFGDAPDGSAGTGQGNYQTSVSDNGARHTIVAGLFLGTQIDAEPDSQGDSQALADDRYLLPTDFDDEDGLIEPGQDLRLTTGTAPQVRVRATNLTANPATLYAWIDYDSDGLFENGSERVSLAVPAGTNNGLFTLTFPTIPIATIAGTTYARFRLSSDLNAAEATGLAADGEVEDYVAKLFRPSVVSIDTSKTEKIAHQLNGGPALLNSDLFGISMAAIGDVDGDGIPDVAVGASGDDFGGTENTNRGAIYIQFMNADGTVRSSTKIASGLNGGPNLLANDAFGTAVAGLGDLDGDGVPEVAVGAVGDDTGGNNRGAIYTLFLRGDGSVKSSVEVASGLNNGPTLVDTSAFGASIASLGDLNGDGVSELAVGATGANLNSGSVYTLFMNRNGTASSSVQTISQALTPSGSLIGSAVASIGDLDNDGITDLAIGDRGYDTPLGDQGAVYIVRMNADGTPKTPLLTISSGVNGGPTLAGGNLFGQSIASLGDLDGDGNTDIAVGASGDASGGAGRGAAYLLMLNSNGSVKSSVKFFHGLNESLNLVNGDNFGRSIAALGDLDGDGITELGVGASGDETGGADRGAWYNFSLRELGISTIFSGSVTENVPIGTTIGNFSTTPLLLDSFGTEVSRVATPLVDASGLTPTRSVGLLVMAITDQGTRTFGFGARSAGGVTAPDGDTFFQVGSISKTFTGLLLASQIESSGGSLLPNTPVNSLLAPDLRLSDFGTQPVTVAQLATHYGSLPAFPNNMTGPAFYPAQGYTRAQLATYLSGFTLSRAPGTVYEYSNTGSGLLAIALGDRAGLAPYSALLGAQITGPLSMSDTGLNEVPFTNGIAARLAQGYRSTGTALVPMAISDMGVLEGAGEIISTGNDMAKFLRVLAGLSPFPVAGAVERTVAPRAPGPSGTMTGYGLDIYTLNNGVQQWEKAGVVAGYTAYIAFRRQPGTAVVVLSNRGQHQAVGPAAREILSLLTPSADSGNTYTFSLVSGAGSTHNGSVSLSPNGLLQTAASVDFESTPTLSVRVRTTRQDGLFYETPFVISVNNANDRPTAQAGGPYVTDEGVGVTFSGSGLDQDAGSSLAYEWDLDYDGVSFQVDATTASPSVTYPDGLMAKTVAMRVTDNALPPQTSSIVTATVTVNNVAPAVDRDNPSLNGSVNGLLTNSGTWSDVPADNVTLGASLGTVVKNLNGTWSWSYTPTGAVVNQVVTITADDEDGGTNATTFTLTVTGAVASVVNRQVFYNNATGGLFGNGTGNPLNAIDTSKAAVLPGQVTSPASYTNYVRGLNGLIVDIDSLPGVPNTSDFAFATWDGINASNFQPTAAVATIEVFNNGGLAGSDRVKLTFADNAIRNTWLRVTVLATATTGLTSNDVFYFGNAVGDFNVGNLLGPPVTVRTNATDASAVRQNQSPGMDSAGISNLYDINKDGRVNASDTSLVRQNQNASIIGFFTAPASLKLAMARDETDAVMSDMAWLEELDSSASRRRRSRWL